MVTCAVVLTLFILDLPASWVLDPDFPVTAFQLKASSEVCSQDFHNLKCTGSLLVHCHCRSFPAAFRATLSEATRFHTISSHSFTRSAVCISTTSLYLGITVLVSLPERAFGSAHGWKLAVRPGWLLRTRLEGIKSGQAAIFLYVSCSARVSSSVVFRRIICIGRGTAMRDSKTLHKGLYDCVGLIRVG